MYFSNVIRSVLETQNTQHQRGAKSLHLFVVLKTSFFQMQRLPSVFFFSQPIALKSGAHSMSTEKSGSWQIIWICGKVHFTLLDLMWESCLFHGNFDWWNMPYSNPKKREYPTLLQIGTAFRNVSVCTRKLFWKAGARAKRLKWWRSKMYAEPRWAVVITSSCLRYKWGRWTIPWKSRTIKK